MGSRKQTSLLNEDAQQAISQSRFQNLLPKTELGRQELMDWKQKVATFQKTVKAAPIMEQASLFDAAPDPAEAIDPFALPQQNTEFWRWQFSDVGVAALYFVVDYHSELLLYVGETVKSNQRWKGEHDCKRYLMNYRQTHYHHDLDSQLGIAFWRHAPADRRPRQKVESALIYKWRSPFNKENWKFWGTPFIGEGV
ncbi:GIY-YIG nuclease family protein [Leptothoe kymatousa]|uniref:GIY-YIG nuclease family protein n=1 Tax=Leptothoe kymatousa TAU-MAC 1615 TaxID=2364775 RepID=A0ABS5Y0Q2_9CYAN|nr:GIY-YIG nuclease family protein [Leptothoe kymatousa]MBT9310585.1 GIY-YIG nuclease family protein [Leptothoe kymatousa TAU-MAC 1615]